MPYRPNRPCSYPECSALVSGRYCQKHKQEIDARYNKMEREPDTYKRYGRGWRRIRAAYLNGHPLCEICKINDRLVPATQVHHIKPLSDGGTNLPNNLQALCLTCHSSITAREGGRWG